MVSTVILIISLCLSVLTTTLDAVGTSTATADTEKEIAALEALQAKVQADNAVDNSTLSQINNSINRIYNLRNVVDPRVIPILDSKLAQAESYMAQITKNIGDRTAAEAEAQKYVVNRPGSFGSFFNFKDGSNAHKIKEIKEGTPATTIVVGSDFETNVQGGKADA